MMKSQKKEWNQAPFWMKVSTLLASLLGEKRSGWKLNETHFMIIADKSFLFNQISVERSATIIFSI